MPGRDIIINLIAKAKGKELKDFGDDLEGLGKKGDKTGGLLQGLSSRLNVFGDNVGKNVTGKLGSAGDAADNLGLGLDDMGAKAGIAAAGVAGLAAFVGGGVAKMKELYDETRRFNEVAGTSWEDGSRLVAVFDDLRVNAEEGAGAMGRLTRTVGESPEKLKEYGIEIVRAKDGTVDMVATLGNVATAFQNTLDPAKRAALGNELFGRKWESMVPVLQRGGEELRDLAASVDESMVATAEGAKQQDELFEATDNLGDAMDSLQRSLAQNLIPTLIAVAENATAAVKAFGFLEDVAKRIYPDEVRAEDDAAMKQNQETAKGFFKEVFSLKEMFTDFSVGDDVKEQADTAAQGVDGMTAALMVGAPALEALKDAADETSVSAEVLKERAKHAGDEFKEFEKRTRDLLQAQEDLREAGRDLINTELALEQAQIRAGDASQEVSTKADVAEKAISDYGSSSREAAIAVEEQRRATVDAKGAIDGAAQAAVTHAQKLAESNGTTLTAAERTKAYREELIRMRAGTVDPELIAWMDAQIERLAGVASQAQNAAENLQGYNEAVFAMGGGEPQFTSRDSSGRAVVRRATGGPVWPGRTYLVGEHGPELLNLPSGSGMNGPGYVLSTPEAQRVDPAMTGMAPPSIRRNLDDGTVQFPDSTKTYPIATAPLIGGMGVGGGAGTAGLVTRLGLSADETGPSLTTKSLGLGGGIVNYYITINGYAELSKLMEAIRRYEGARF